MQTKYLWTVALIAALGLSASAESLKWHEEKSLPAKPGGTLKVEASFQDVLVTIAPGSTIRVAVDIEVSSWPGDSKTYLDALKPVYREEGNTILVRSRASHWTIGYSNCRGTIALKVPPGMALDLRSGSGDCRIDGDTAGMPATCDTGSGDVEIHGAARSVTADTGSGDVRIRLAARAEKVKIDTGSGDVDFQGEAGEFEGDTGSGGITAMGLTGSARFDTGSGDVKAGWERLPAGTSVTADTGSGGVQLTLPAGTALSGLLGSSSGEIRCDFPGTLSSREKRYELSGGGGSASVRVKTGSGDITIRKGA
jgi:hypothetical protein